MTNDYYINMRIIGIVTVVILAGCLGCTPKEAKECIVSDVIYSEGDFLSPGMFLFRCEDGRSSSTILYTKPGDTVLVATGRLGDYYVIYDVKKDIKCGEAKELNYRSCPKCAEYTPEEAQ